MVVRSAKAGVEATGHAVAVVGAGPAGMFAARALAAAGHEVVIINRDIKPGGLAEYGIYPDKIKMKSGLRKQFWKILEEPRIRYLGGVRVAEGGDMTLKELRGLGFSALVLAVGAQGTKLLGLPGEQAEGVYHAKDLVYWYNRLPPFTDMAVRFGRRVAIVGVGNVMVDIAHWIVLNEPGVEEVVILCRRGPAERKYTPKEISYIAAAFDRERLAAEIERIRPQLEAVGQDPEGLLAELTASCDVPLSGPSAVRVTFEFLTSPVAIEADEAGRVAGVRVERNALVPREGGEPGSRGLGQFEVLPIDTMVYAIGDSVDPALGLPVGREGFATAQGGDSYQAEEGGAPVDGVFLVGWSRRASDGLVGKARQDAEIGCVEVNAWLAARAPEPAAAGAFDRLMAALAGCGADPMATEAVRRLVEIEDARAEAEGLEEFKFGTDAEMRAAILQI